MILSLMVPYLMDGQRAAAVLSVTIGGATLGYGIRTVGKVRSIPVASVALMVAVSFTAGAVIAKLMGLY